MGKSKNKSNKTKSGSVQTIDLFNRGFGSDSETYKTQGFKAKAVNHAYPRETFINPYVFYTVDEPVTRSGVETGGFSGKIICTLEVKSPIFIPNTTQRYEDSETAEHYMYDFFSYEDLYERDKGKDKISVAEFSNLPLPKPVIPGSELRGMVRNMYEILTNSCFSVVDEDNLPYKRTNTPKLPAIMRYEDGKWLIYDKLASGSDYIKIGLYDPAPNGYIIHKTAYIGRKKHNIAFSPEPSGTGTPVEANALIRFEHVIDSYCNEKVNKTDIRPYLKYRERYKNKEPIFVYTDETRAYLSPSCMTKEFFVNTVSSILEKQGEHQPCKNSLSVCPACAMFGMVSKDGSIKSRVRFSDAKLAEDCEIDFQTATLPILGNPRISATEFYLKPPSEGFRGMWNYDYYTRVNDGGLRTEYDPILSGRKVYWHGAYKAENAPKTKMNNTVRMLTEGKFTFNVWFDRLTETELRDLLYALTLKKGEVHDWHKIGHGKPIGMGDVFVMTDSITLHSYKQTKGRITVENSLIAPEDYETEKDTSRIHVFTQLLSDELAKKVDYPRPVNTNEIYRWFGNNRGSVNKPVVEQTLKPITSPYDAITEYELQKK